MQARHKNQVISNNNNNGTGVRGDVSPPGNSIEKYNQFLDENLADHNDAKVIEVPLDGNLDPTIAREREIIEMNIDLLSTKNNTQKNITALSLRDYDSGAYASATGSFKSLEMTGIKSEVHLNAPTEEEWKEVDRL